MSEAVIKSRGNPAVRRARAVRDGRDRDFVFVEGVRLCEEALGASLDIETVFHAESLREDERGSRLLASLERAGGRLLAITEDVLDFVSDTKTSQGVVALARRPRATEDAFEPLAGVPLVVVLHRVSNPANAGAMLRVAEAAGATGVVATAGTTDLLSPKALRGSMGSAFRLPLWTGAALEEVLRWCAARGIRTVATASDAPRAHTEVDWKTTRAVVVGPEASGLSTEELAAADERVRVPMRAGVESLNAAVALGVVLYEAARQRGFAWK
ncbi:MAG TPA: RNA methyltransferase [Pyrinomonadaceae bacterium]